MTPLPYVTTSEGLKNCPCCGSAAQYTYMPDPTYNCNLERVGCTHCPLQLPNVYHTRGHQRKYLYSKWNQRSFDFKTSEEVKSLLVNHRNADIDQADIASYALETYIGSLESALRAYITSEENNG